MDDQTTNKSSIIIIGPEISAVQAVDIILERAARSRASDIHCDPTDGDTIIRLRIDGQMEHSGIIPRHIHDELISRLKILSGARTDIHAIPQDGRWQAHVDGSSYHIRASFMPTYHGENVVLRLLPSCRRDDIDLARLGFGPDHIRSIRSALSLTSGLILVTGPTGSGKTTTLYSCLMAKSDEPLSIVTLEDPVEYEMPGIRQVHIRHSFGVTFASGLRSALRQDPDVIMVGEIRDAETARVAVHTALTGHLVLSTLHTNSALEAIPRLIDMGVDPYLLASTLRLSIAQRLIRTVCRECWSDGCEMCRSSGYSGRSLIAEVCPIGDDMRDLIMRRDGIGALRACAVKHGFVSIDEDGREKSQWGVTTAEEVQRVLGDQ